MITQKFSQLPAIYFVALSLNAATPAVQPAAIPANKTSPIVVNTLPNARCSLRVQGDSGTTRSLTLYSNDQGQLRFFAQAKGEIDGANFDLQCQASNQTMENTIQLRASAAITDATPAALLPPRNGPSAHIRPPLTGDPMAPSQAELFRLGYPLRPDPGQEPEAYATWLRMVTTETTIIEPRLVTQPGRFHAVRVNPNPNPPPQPILPSSNTSLNWSGFGLYQDPRLLDFNPPAPYVMVSAEWFVPEVTFGEAFTLNDSALWAGLDGLTSNSKDVLQDGTEQQMLGDSFQGVPVFFANYYAWAEFFPFPEQEIANFPISPGDHMVSLVFMQDPVSGNAEVNGTVGVCILEDLTARTSTFALIDPPAGVQFTGSSAEWIMERPTVNNQLPDLSNYYTAALINAFAIRSDQTIVNANGTGYTVNLTMVDSNNTPLSEVVPFNNTNMMFVWLGYK